MYPLLGLAGIGIVSLAYTYANGGPGNLVSIKSKLDNREYMVQDLPDKQEAADKLAQIRAYLETLLNEYKNPEYSQDAAAQRLIERFNVNNIMENSVTSQHTSYSENKGEKIVLCLRDKTKAPYPFVDINTVMFVTLHEMSHLMTASNGHTNEFWANFKRLLQDALKLGIYQQVNYSRNPVDYCGMTITDSPL